MQITSGEELAEIVLRGRRGRVCRVAVHAIGDARTARRSTRSSRRARSGRRSGCATGSSTRSCSRPEDLPRFAELGVAASVQFSHAPSDRDLADRYWGDKTAGAYAYRSLVDSGAVVANGSDAPIEELDPLAGIRAGVRRTIDERAAWHPEQALTVQQAFEATMRRAGVALRATSAGAAGCCPGYAADLVVLDRDPWDDLDAEVVATMVAGRWVHNPPPWD